MNSEHILLLIHDGCALPSHMPIVYSTDLPPICYSSSSGGIYTYRELGYCYQLADSQAGCGKDILCAASNN